MLINIQGRKLEVTPPLKSYALEKVSVLNKFLHFSLRVHVTLSVDKFRQRAEVFVSGKGLRIHGVEETEDMYASIDKVMDKVARQARKFKEKRSEHSLPKEAGVHEEPHYESEGPKIIKTAPEHIKPITTSEAIDQLNENNMQFLVYRNSPGEGINVLYHRSDGNMGLIET